MSMFLSNKKAKKEKEEGVLSLKVQRKHKKWKLHD